MARCERCEVDVHPALEMQADGRFLPTCPRCQGPMAAAPQAVASASAPRLAVATATTTDKPIEYRVIDATRPTALDGRALLAFAKQRREEIGRRLTELHQLEAEALMLDRMIDAADGHGTADDEARIQ